MTIINSTLPQFNLEAYHDNKFIKINTEQLRGQWSVLFFYPADFTFVCPTELGDLADHYEQLQKMNVQVYSVSTDKHFTHKAWHDASETIKKIKFPMIADPAGTLTQSLGVLVPEDFVALRATFVVNPQLQIKVAEIHDLGIGRSAEELIRKIQAAQYVAANPNQACPAKWTPGAEALTPSLDLVGKI